MKAACPRGHARTPENVDSSGSCKICKRELARKRYAADPEKGRQKCKRFRENNATAFKESLAKYRSNNKDARNALSRKWARENKNRVAEHLANRRAMKLKATPVWLTENQKKEISQFYTCAQLLTVITGEKHHVDHVIPLKHPSVCGLHVPWNLQYLTALQNQTKKNSFTPGPQW